jgi:hypothetical protein
MGVYRRDGHMSYCVPDEMKQATYALKWFVKWMFEYKWQCCWMFSLIGFLKTIKP